MASYDFGIVLGLAYQSFVERLHAELARHGFTKLGPAYGYVIRSIDGEPGIRQQELARRLSITAQGTGKVIDAMVRARLVTRTPDPDDARAYRLALGARGRELLRIARQFHADYERDLARRLGSSVATTRRVLEAIVAEGDDGTAQGRLRAT